jgi:hypothetical protein
VKQFSDIVFLTALQYSHCTGDLRSVNNLVSPVGTFQKSTSMQLYVQFLSNDMVTIDVYQAALGHVDILLATLSNPQTIPLSTVATTPVATVATLPTGSTARTLPTIATQFTGPTTVSTTPTMSSSTYGMPRTMATTVTPIPATVFNVCLPAGTYSIVFVVKAVCNTTCNGPLINFLSVDTSSESHICAGAPYSFQGMQEMLRIPIF